MVRKLCFGVFSTTFCRSRRRHLFEDLPNCASPAFGSDNYAGVEDHSHAGGSRGLRFLMISSTSAAKSESIDDDLCPGAHWGHHTGKVAGASASEMWMTFFATAGIMPLPNVRTSLSGLLRAAKNRALVPGKLTSGLNR